MEKSSLKENRLAPAEKHKKAMRTQEEAEHSTGARKEALIEKAEDQAEGRHASHEEGPSEGKGHVPTS